MKFAPFAPKYVGPPKWSGGNNKPILRITIHCTAGAEPSVENAAANTVAYSKNTDRASSFHYVRDAKVCLQYTYDSVVAYHAPPNEHSLGYELCCSLSDEGKGHWATPSHQTMLKEAAKDIAQLCLDYDIPVRRLTIAQLRRGEKGLCGHVDVRDAFRQTSHWDPGPYFPWKQFLALIEAHRRDLLTPPTVTDRGVHIENAIADLEKASKKGKKGDKVKRALRILRRVPKAVREA